MAGPRITWKHLLYPVFGLLVVAGYGWVAASGFEPFAAPAERRVLPPEMRTGPGSAYGRSAGVWYGGFHGGK